MNIIKRFENGELVEYLIDGESVIGVGSKIEKIANPIARLLKLPCIDPKTRKTKPESGCGKMKARLNAGVSVVEAIKLRLQGK